MTHTALTHRDVDALLSGTRTETRTVTAAKVADVLRSEALTEDERRIADEIVHLLAADIAVQVRQALAEGLKDCPDMPHDVAVRLAQDVEDVALPILRFSDVLSDDDLVAIVRGHDPRRQKAIAMRARVSPRVSEALVDDGTEDVVVTLAENRGAVIPETALIKALDTYGENSAMQEALTHRPALPPSVTERLVFAVSEAFSAELTQAEGLPADLVTDLVLRARECATLALSSDADAMGVAEMARSLNRGGRLTPSLVLRSLCLGDVSFFEAAMAELASIPVANAGQLIEDRGARGFEALYRQSGLPQAYLPTFRAAIDVATETDYDGLDNDRERYRQRVTERLLTQLGHHGIEFEAGDLNYLLGKIIKDGADGDATGERAGA